MQVPDKMHDGDSPLKIKKLWNDLIDYLRADRLTAGSGVSLRRLPSGTIISAAGEKAAAPARESAAEGGYSGYFKVVSELDENKNVVYKVVDGAYPTGKICGYTDIGVVYAGTVAYRPGYQLDIYLKAERKGNIYEFSFCDNEYGSAIQLLATVRNGIIYQQWQGGVIYFSSRYMV